MFHRLKKGFYVFFTALLLWNCSDEPKVNKVITYEISGICSKCPSERLDSILHEQEGILKVTINEQNSLVEIGFDSTIIKEADIINVMNDHGYDVGLNIAILVNNKAKCCEEVIENGGTLSEQDSTNQSTEAGEQGGQGRNKKYSSEDLEDLLSEDAETPEEKIGKEIIQVEKKLDTEVEQDLEETVDLADKEMDKLAKELEEAENTVKEDVKLDYDANAEIEEYLRKMREKQKKK